MATSTEDDNNYYNNNITDYNTDYFWEPHSSSIDFCEKNYVHSKYIVEFHNTWSSIIGLAALGFIGLAMGGNPTKEKRFTIAYCILIIIGFGSAGLHGTLHWIFQSSDELPMIYLAVVLNYIGLQLDEEKIHPVVENATSREIATVVTTHPTTTATTTLLCLFIVTINTFVYYRYQHLYIVFIVTYSFAVMILAGVIFKLLVLQRHLRTYESQTIGRMSVVWYLVIAVPIWMVDMFCCETILTWNDEYLQNLGIIQGFTPHVLWHFCAGLGTYYTIIFFAIVRMENRKRPFTVRYILCKIVPTIISDSTTTSATSKKQS